MKASDGIYYLKRGSVCKIDGFSITFNREAQQALGIRKTIRISGRKMRICQKEDEKQILKSLQENNYTFDLIFTHTVPECMVKAWFPDKGSVSDK